MGEYLHMGLTDIERQAAYLKLFKYDLSMIDLAHAEILIKAGR
jgi:hypothetical protein